MRTRDVSACRFRALAVAAVVGALVSSCAGGADAGEGSADAGGGGAVAAQRTSTSTAAPKEEKTTDTTGEGSVDSLGGLVAARPDVFVGLAERGGTPLVAVGRGVRPAEWQALYCTVHDTTIPQRHHSF